MSTAFAYSYPPAADVPLVGGAAPSPKATALLQRYNELMQHRQLHDHIWQDQVELILPGAADITRYRAPGSSRTDRLFDTSATMAAHILAGHLMGSVTNQFIQWFTLAFRDPFLKDNQTVSAWLNQCDDIMMRAFAGSNFYQAAHTFYLHLSVFGTAAMYCGTAHRLDAGGRLEAYLRFATLPTGHYVLAENHLGKVDTLIRCLELTPRQAVQEFGEVQISRDLRHRARNPLAMDRPRRFLHAVYPRRIYDPTKRGNRHMPYEEIYLELDTKHICRESGHEEFPFVVARWETIGTSPWGFGPGHIALPDIRTINVLRELMLLQLQLWVQPPLTALEEGVLGSISLESLAVNVLTREDALKPLDLTGRPDLVKIEEQQLRQSIRDVFYADALSGLPPVEATQMTAYEVAQRIEQMQRLMGPAFTRLLSEMLEPLIDRTFGILWRARQFPRMPPEVVLAAQQNQGQLDIEYRGPLARAQKGSEVKSISESLAVASQIVGLTQRLDILDNIDLDEAWRAVADANGTPAHLLKDTVQVQQMRLLRQQQQQAMAQQAQMAQQAESMGKMAPMVKVLGGPQATGAAA